MSYAWCLQCPTCPTMSLNWIWCPTMSLKVLKLAKLSYICPTFSNLMQTRFFIMWYLQLRFNFLLLAPTISKNFRPRRATSITDVLSCDIPYPFRNFISEYKFLISRCGTDIISLISLQGHWNVRINSTSNG